MKFKLLEYSPPNFKEKKFVDAPNCTLVEVEKDGVSPRNFHALSMHPEYFKVNDKWILATESRMDTVCVVDDSLGKEELDIVEFRNLKKGDKVVVGRTEDASQGIYVWTDGFISEDKIDQSFAFRSGRSRETAFSVDYDKLYRLLKYEKDNKGYVTLVVGSSLALDRDSRRALENLIRNGYVDAIFCGTETAAFDLEKGIHGTSWGQKVFTRQENSAENLYDTINLVRKYGSIKAMVQADMVEDGFIKAAIECDVSLVIPATIRDQFSLPETIDDVYKGQDEMRKHARKTSTLIMMGSILYTIATGNMTSSYNELNERVRPIYMYTVDIQEFAVNKLSDRGTLTAVTMVTNTQDFIRNLDRALCPEYKI